MAKCQAAEGNYFPDEDWAFHQALHEPLGNAMVVDLLSVFWRTFAQVDARLPGARYTPAAAWHRDLLNALESANPDTYARSMKRHFNGIHTRLGE